MLANNQYSFRENLSTYMPRLNLLDQVGSPVFRSLTPPAKGPGFDSPIAQHVRRLINFSGIYVMGVKLVPYSLFLIRKGIRNEKYVSFLIPYLIRNKE